MAGVVLKIVEKGGSLAALAKRARELDAGDVKVGVFAGGPAREDGELTNVEIAAVHEYGAPEAGIPERSFIRSTFAEERETYAALLKKMLPRVIEGKLEVKKMFDILGAKVVADINRKVRSGEGVPPPLKPATIARKGSSRPLIDTGRMIAAVTWATFIGGESA